MSLGSDGRPSTCIGGHRKVSDEQENNKLVGKEITKYRSIVARLNYLAQDRPDIQFAVRECAKEMSSPTSEGLEKMKRIGRYLKQIVH